jgi:hypothetical protein
MKPSISIAAFSAFVSLSLPASIANAETIGFGSSLSGSGWETVQFALISRAKFTGAGDAVKIRTEGNGALIWKPVPNELAGAQKASWSWAATKAVPATNLARKGGDDRVVSVYFLFGSEGDVGKSATRLLRSDTTRAVVYTFGSDVKRGTVVSSPHMGKRGKFIVLRSVANADGQLMAENADLAKDYERLFGETPNRLLGVAISSDSDDTGAVNEAVVQGVNVQ